MTMLDVTMKIMIGMMKMKEKSHRMNFEEGEILLRLSNLDEYMSRFLQKNMYNKANVIN